MQIKVYRDLTGEPCDMAAVDSKRVIVSLSSKDARLLICKVAPCLELEKTIKVEEMCWGIEVVNKEVYVTIRIGEGEDVIRVLDMEGDIKR